LVVGPTPSQISSGLIKVFAMSVLIANAQPISVSDQSVSVGLNFELVIYRKPQIVDTSISRSMMTALLSV